MINGIAPLDCLNEIKFAFFENSDRKMLCNK